MEVPHDSYHLIMLILWMRVFSLFHLQGQGKRLDQNNRISSNRAKKVGLSEREVNIYNVALMVYNSTFKLSNKPKLRSTSTNMVSW